MTDATQNQNALAQGQNRASPPAQLEKKRGMSTADMLVIAGIALGFAVVIIYQVYFCPTCYSGGGRVISY